MRQLAIAVLGFWLAAGSAGAQATHPTTYGTFAPNLKPPKPIGGAAAAPFKTPEPYRAYTPRPAPASPKPPKLIGSTQTVPNIDGGKPFTPPKPYKPYRAKSVYDH